MGGATLTSGRKGWSRNPYSRTLTFQLRRALGLITVRQIPSLVDGVAMACKSVWLCRLWGWNRPTDVPAVGTFYAFLRRLHPETRHRHGTLRRSSGRRLKLKRGQKMPPRRLGGHWTGPVRSYAASFPAIVELSNDGVGWFNLKNPGSSFLSEITQSCQEVPLNFR